MHDLQCSACFKSKRMEVIRKYFPDITEKQERQFSMLDALYRQWNAAINVISRRDIDNLYINHVLHSLAIAGVIRFTPGTTVLDVGTGGGFPGIPLAILFPETDFHLIDSIGKKIKVVNGVSTELGLENVTATQHRVEDIKFRYDFVVSRAVTALPEFIAVTKKNITRRTLNPLHNGILYLKGGEVAEIKEEIQLTGAKSMLYPVASLFDEPWFDTKYVVHLWF